MRLSSLLPLLGVAAVGAAAADAQPDTQPDAAPAAKPEAVAKAVPEAKVEAKTETKAEATVDEDFLPTTFDGIEVPPMINLTPKNFDEYLNHSKYLFVKHYR